MRGPTTVALPPKVFDTLLYMVENPDRLLSKDELMEAIWPGRVLEESNLSQNIFTLRKALSDGGQGRWIVTAPGRGYRFTASVRQVDRVSAKSDSPGVATAADAPPVPALPRPGIGGSKRVILAAAGVLVLAVAGVLLFVGHPQGDASVKHRSRILITGITNLTGDPAFDVVPGKVLEVGLSQSPFLALIPLQQVSRTLALMKQPAIARLSTELAQEVCLRNRGTSVLSGTIAAFGTGYVVILEASDCATGERIAQSTLQAPRKEDVPTAVDHLAQSMRTQLGESLASIRKFDVPIEQATTSSFEALRAYSAGRQARENGDNDAAVTLFKRAVEIDPSFASAYAELAAACVSLREPELARSYYQKAFELKDRASEKEKLWISAEYFKLAGNLADAINSYRAMAALYPTDGWPWESLADLYTRTARYHEAVDAASEGLRLDPDDGRAYNILARAYKRSNRFVEANAIGRQAIAKRLDGWPMHGLLYEMAFALGDTAAMSEQVAKETGKPGEAWLVEYQAWAAATAGQLNRCRALFEQALALEAASSGKDQAATVSQFYTDYMQALALFGLQQEARVLVARAPGLEDNEDAPYVLALVGDFERAAALDAELGTRYPESTLNNSLTRPKVQAVIALGQGRPRDALAALQPSLSAKLHNFDAPSLLGQAHLDLKEANEAAAEFTAVLDNRGVDAISPAYPLAYLGLARSMQLKGDVRRSRAAYESLFAFWKNADADNPVLLRARGEYAALSDK